MVISTHWAENLFDDNVEVVSNDGQSTVERGGILAWRLFAKAGIQELSSLNTDVKWFNTEWKDARCVWHDDVFKLFRTDFQAAEVDKFHPEDTSSNPCPHVLSGSSESLKAGCGFYSFKTYWRAMMELVEYTCFYNYSGSLFQICPVLIGGRVIEHVDGYRSSRMRLINPTYPHAMSVSDAQAYAESIGASFEKEGTSND